MRTLAEVQKEIAISPDQGLSGQSASDSRRKFGENRLTPLPREPIWKKFLEKFDEPIIKILLAAALLSMFVDLFRGDEGGGGGHQVLAGILLGVVGLAALALYVLKQQQWLPSL